MTSKISSSVKHLVMDFNQFKEEYPWLNRWLIFFVLLAYGVRMIHDNIFLGSEIAVLRPDSMHQLWIGSNRFGLAFTSRLFGMSRLIPYVSCFLGVIMLWASAVLLSFSAYEWCGKSRRYKFFCICFPSFLSHLPFSLNNTFSSSRLLRFLLPYFYAFWPFSAPERLSMRRNTSGCFWTFL